jgi:hypothetical protein
MEWNGMEWNVMLSHNTTLDKVGLPLFGQRCLNRKIKGFRSIQHFVAGDASLVRLHMLVQSIGFKRMVQCPLILK